MAKVKETFLSDESSEDDDAESFHNDFESNRASFSDYETNRASLSDLESNHLAFSEHETPLSDPDVPEFTDNNQHLSESNSEEESRTYFQLPPVRTEKVTFHKYGQPPKVVHKQAPSPALAAKRTLSCSDSEDQEEVSLPQPKRSKYDGLVRPATKEALITDKAKAMMEKMGYQKGKGLGRNAQGRVDPVEMSKQRGRRGLGLTVPGLEPESLVWDSSSEVVQVEERPVWLAGDHLPALDNTTLYGWLGMGPRNMNITDCTDFCDPAVLTEILDKKTIFDSLEGDEMRRARTRSNPFETIGKGIFLNRAAMKMANMDKVFDFMFTSPMTKDNEPMVKKDQLLYFADVCAGPGGFSEYVLWRKKWRAKGFGFTLKGENDFKLSDFFAGPCESFEPFYGVKGDGDVFDPTNIESLMHFVMDNTQQEGVHFMMADGGFSVDGQENIQELLSKQLYLCQFLVALCIVRTGGHFVCKLFDVFSPFSVGLVYLMYRAFHQISIHKPNTSRPANSERYIICKWKRDDCEPTREYLFNLNKDLCRLGKNSKDDINYCVSMEELTQDRTFYNYIYESNNLLGDRQVVNLMKIAAFCRDMSLTEVRQAQVRRECLKYWDVPDQTRRVDNRTPDEVAAKLLPSSSQDFLKSEPIFLRSAKDFQYFKSLFDWHCMPVGTQNDLHFFIGLGRNRVYRLLANGKTWKKVEATNLELSPGTLVYGEMVPEYQGESRSQMKRAAFHIIDAVSLGDEEVSHLHYTERLKLCELFTESLNKSTKRDLCPLRAKTVYPLDNLSRLFEGLTVYQMKSGLTDLLLKIKESAFCPKGVLFFRATKDPWMRCMSKTHNQCYYYRPGAESLFDAQRPKDACASTMECIAKRLAWWWEQGVGVKQEKPKENVVHKDQLLHFIRDRLGKR